jgi:hypothetical protein
MEQQQELMLLCDEKDILQILLLLVLYRESFNFLPVTQTGFVSSCQPNNNMKQQRKQQQTTRTSPVWEVVLQQQFV